MSPTQPRAYDPHLFAEMHPHQLPDRLHTAALQLTAAIQAGTFTGAGPDAECQLRGFSVFLSNAEETARDIVAQLRRGGDR